MQFDIQRSITLLSPQYFREVTIQNNCQFLVSVFKENQHNFIIPSKEFTANDAAKNVAIIKQYAQEGTEFSYYIPDALFGEVEDVVGGTGVLLDGNTRYLFKHTNESYELPEHEVIRLNEDNFDKFRQAATICFPEWNNTAFTEWCLNCPEVTMLAVVIENEIAAFAGYFSKADDDYVLLMNAGTLPNFRRHGFHSYMVKYRINEVLKQKDSALFYVDVDDSGASHQSILKLGFENGPVFRSYN